MTDKIVPLNNDATELDAINVNIYEDENKNEWIIWGHSPLDEKNYAELDEEERVAVTAEFAEEAAELGLTKTDRVKFINFDEFEFKSDKTIEKPVDLIDLLTGYDPTIRAMQLTSNVASSNVN